MKQFHGCWRCFCSGSTPATLPLCCPLKVPSRLPPEGVCTCFLLCLESSCLIAGSLIPFRLLMENASSWALLSTSFQIVIAFLLGSHFPIILPYSSPWCVSPSDKLYTHWFVCYLFPASTLLDHKLHVARDCVLFLLLLLLYLQSLEKCRCSLRLCWMAEQVQQESSQACQMGVPYVVAQGCTKGVCFYVMGT